MTKGKLNRADVVAGAALGLLLIVLVPVLLARPREQAMRQVCEANLRQYGVAHSLYLDDSDDRYPDPRTCLTKTAYPVAGYQRYCRWHDPRYPMDGPVWAYLPQDRVHLCPTFSVAAKALGGRHANHDASVPIEPYYSYSMNVLLGSKIARNPREDGLMGAVQKRSEITRSLAEVFFFGEENIWARPSCVNVLNDNALCGNGFDWFGTFHGLKSNPKGADLNTGTINVVFVDGHVDKVKSGLQIVNGQADRSTAESHEGFICEKFAWPRAFVQPTGNP